MQCLIPTSLIQGAEAPTNKPFFTFDNEYNNDYESGKIFYHVTTGTGFFVNYDKVITNEHVVKDCTSIRIKGAVKSSYARLKAVDKNHDLALLETDLRSSDVVRIRANNTLAKGDPVTVIGYPLKQDEEPKMVLFPGKVINVNFEFNDIQSIEFTEGVKKGNSGGPLLDKAGNVVGVVVGSVNYFLKHGDVMPDFNRKPERSTSVAIGLPVLVKFLKTNHVLPYMQSTYDVFQQEKPQEKAQPYLVHVQCFNSSVKSPKP